MSIFRFRRFDVDDCGCGQKICSDSVLFGAWFFRAFPDARSVMDVGTGSGVLALLAADLIPHATVEAVEIDETAYEVACNNFQNSPFKNRLRAYLADVTSLDCNNTYDLIVCNPPFFAAGIKAEDARRAIARHEGNLNAASMARFAALHLCHDGHLGLITPADREQDVIFDAEMAGLTPARILRVSSSVRKPHSRILWDFVRRTDRLSDKSLSIRDSHGQYSPEYLALVEDIYLKL